MCVCVCVCVSVSVRLRSYLHVSKCEWRVVYTWYKHVFWYMCVIFEGMLIDKPNFPNQVTKVVTSVCCIVADYRCRSLSTHHWAMYHCCLIRKSLPRFGSGLNICKQRPIQPDDAQHNHVRRLCNVKHTAILFRDVKECYRRLSNKTVFADWFTDRLFYDVVNLYWKSISRITLVILMLKSFGGTKVTTIMVLTTSWWRLLQKSTRQYRQNLWSQHAGEDRNQNYRRVLFSILRHSWDKERRLVGMSEEKRVCEQPWFINPVSPCCWSKTHVDIHTGMKWLFVIFVIKYMQTFDFDHCCLALGNVGLICILLWCVVWPDHSNCRHNQLDIKFCYQTGYQNGYRIVTNSIIGCG